MRFLVTGVGDAFTERHFGSSAVVEGPDGHFLIDCPDLIHRALREARETSGWDAASAANIDDILLTHLHGDHCNGLESFAFWRAIRRNRGEIDRMPRLHTHTAAANRVWERLAPAMDGNVPGTDRRATLADYFQLRPFEVGEQTTVCGCTVRARLTHHPVPTVGLLVSDGRRTLGWSGDTAFDPQHIEWLNQADLIVHEVNRGAVHTHIDQLNALPDELRARMRLIHMTDDHDPDQSDIKPLREGEVVEF